jgi:hypothetical protein
VLVRLIFADPFFIASDFQFQAKRALWREGNYRNCLIYAQVFGEMILDQTVLCLAWEDDIEPRVACEWFERTNNVAKRATARLSKQLSGTGSWDYKSENTVLGLWVKEVSHIRNRVVHAGYEPTHEEACRALQSCERLASLIRERLINKIGKYPRTCLLYAGREFIESSGSSSKRFREFLDSADEEPSWVDQRKKWLDAFAEEKKRSGC